MAESAALLPGQATADNLAYVIYTSGSTGRPKGIGIIHQGVVRMLYSAGYAAMGPGETFLQLAPIAYDAATVEIWSPLLHGGKLVIHPPQSPSLAELAAAIESWGITTLWLTTGLFHQMAEAHPDSLQKMRHVMTGGDVMQVALVKKIGELLNRVGHRLSVFYGPAENTTFSSCYPVTDPDAIGSSVPIGKPIAYFQLFVLDPYLQPVPVGVVGEICVSGGRVRGYLNQPALTAASFVPHPFSAEPGARLYRSGDLGRYLPSGEVEFMGRSDHQVKVRGFRVELAEIETALGRHPAVAEAVVLVRRKKSGSKYLVAYIVPAPPSAERISFSQSTIDLRRELHHFLQSKLPVFMLPAAYMFIEAIPLPAHEKIDREALPLPDLDRPELTEQYESPRTPVEEILVELWSEVLDIDPIGVQDDFFALGGHSLLATQLISRIQKIFKINLPLQALFESPTLAGLAQVMPRYESQPGQVEATARLRQKIKAMSPAEKQAALAQHRQEQGSN
jgi:aspartate racemase